MTLREAGAKYSAIAEQLGYKSPASAYRAVVAGLKKTLQEPAEELRKLDEVRYDRLILALWQRALDGNLEAYDRLLKAMRQRGALLGLNAPAQIEQTITEIKTLRERYARRKQAPGDQG